jgi:glucosamine--fructose-6-phosphate aminotransferase (isomerizing)
MLIAARGTSDNAARYAKYILGSFNQIPVALAAPSLYTVYKKPPKLSRTLVVGISQSGQSPDIIAVLENARKQNQTTLCITNDPNSPLAQITDHVIPLHCGKEQSVAASKTFTSSLTALAMLSIALEKDAKRESALKALPPLLEKTIESANSVIAKTCRYRYIEHCVVIGRGYNYATAFEIALKVKELTRVVSVPYSSADFKHGPIAAVQPGFPVMLVAPKGKMHTQMVEFSSKMHELDAELISISDDDKIIKHSNLGFRIPNGIDEWLTPIACTIPGQLFARQLAFEKGRNIDHPVGLSKVTETY